MAAQALLIIGLGVVAYSLMSQKEAKVPDTADASEGGGAGQGANVVESSHLANARTPSGVTVVPQNHGSKLTPAQQAAAKAAAAGAGAGAGAPADPTPAPSSSSNVLLDLVNWVLNPKGYKAAPAGPSNPHPTPVACHGDPTGPVRAFADTAYMHPGTAPPGQTSTG